MNLILKQLLDVKNQELDALNTSFIGQYNFYHSPEYFHEKSGREHFRLLMHISKLFNKQLLFDYKTDKCIAAAALSSSLTNRVNSYDTTKKLFSNPILPGVKYCYGHVISDPDLIKSHFIFLDNGGDTDDTNVIFNHLRKINWRGLVILDDILVSDNMKKFWNDIPEEKYDISNIGHWSGSALINFNF